MAQSAVKAKRSYGGQSTDILAALVASQNKIKHYSATVDPASQSANATANTSVAVAGVKVGDFIIAIPPATLEHGIIVQGCSCAVAGTILLRLSNVTGGAINPASATWGFLVVQNDQLSVI